MWKVESAPVWLDSGILETSWWQFLPQKYPNYFETFGPFENNAFQGKTSAATFKGNILKIWLLFIPITGHTGWHTWPWDFR